jgi:hypothetical protein
MKPQLHFLARCGLPLLAIPVSFWIACYFFDVCSVRDWLIYQWPSYIACYLPLWAYLWMQYVSETGPDLKHDERVKIGLRGLNTVYAGVLLRLAATSGVLFYWKDEKLYKPVYTFLMHMASFFVFQLATLILYRKPASEP